VGRPQCSLIFRNARTHNVWLNKPVEDSLLRQVYDLARLRPTSAAPRWTHGDHPGIVGVYDVCEHEGLPYLSLELVEGGSLKQLLAGISQPPCVGAAVLRALVCSTEGASLLRSARPT
jgi:serine/threonine protein kinase